MHPIEVNQALICLIHFISVGSCDAGAISVSSQPKGDNFLSPFYVSQKTSASQ